MCRAGIGGDGAEVPARERVLPHERVHGGGEDDRLRQVPRPPDAGQAVVAQADGELRERVGVERRDQEQVGPLPQFDVQHRVAAVVALVAVAARPLVRVEVTRSGSRLAGEADDSARTADRRGVEEVRRGVGGDDLHRVAGGGQRVEERRDAHRRHAPGRPEQDVSHVDSAPGWGNGSAVEVLLQRVWPTASERKGVTIGHAKPLRSSRVPRAPENMPSVLAPLLVKSWSVRGST